MPAHHHKVVAERDVADLLKVPGKTVGEECLGGIARELSPIGHRLSLPGAQAHRAATSYFLGSSGRPRRHRRHNCRSIRARTEVYGGT